MRIRIRIRNPGSINIDYRLLWYILWYGMYECCGGSGRHVAGEGRLGRWGGGGQASHTKLKMNRLYRIIDGQDGVTQVQAQLFNEL
jgi:hypothetical protein